MAEYIELTEELKLSMRAGARAIINTKKYHGTIYMQDVFSDSPKEIPYLKAAEILYDAPEKQPVYVAPVVHGRWIDMQEDYSTEGMWRCSACGSDRYFDIMTPTECWCYYCPNCGARMDGGSYYKLRGEIL